MSMVLRNLHSTITEEYGLPSWSQFHNFLTCVTYKRSINKLAHFENTARQHAFNRRSIEIGLEHALFVVLVYFFPHLNMQKTC